MKKNFTPFTTCGESWKLTAFPAGKSVLELADDTRVLMRVNRGEFAGFSEVSALPEIFRLHKAEDGFSAELETRSVIPFGSEFKVERNVVITDGIASMVTSVAACNRGEVGNITLETLEFPGPWAKVSYLLYGDEKMHTCKYRENASFYEGAELPWYIQVEYRDGSKAEFMTGSDVWRHRAGVRMEGVSAAFRIADAEGTLVFERAVLQYAEETPVEKRPWQFETLFAWSNPAEDVAADEFQEIPVPGCIASRNVQKNLRHAVRSSEKHVKLTNYTAKFCNEAAHLDRPGKKVLEHIDIQELLQFSRWANRQLNKKGLTLTVVPGEEKLLPGSLLIRRLSKLPKALLCDEDEE